MMKSSEEIALEEKPLIPEPPEAFSNLLLEQGHCVDPETLGTWWAELYDDLKRIAWRALRAGQAVHTISSTVLVHEAYMRLEKSTGLRIRNSDHFLALSALAMRQVLVDYVRGKGREKRQHIKIPFEEGSVGAGVGASSLLAMDQALRKLEMVDSKMVRVVECRFFAELSVPETAAALGVSSRTVDRLWQKARMMLRHLLGSEHHRSVDARPDLSKREAAQYCP